MRRAVLFAYFLFPAALYFATGVFEGGLANFRDDVRFFLPNYLFFTAPQIVWLVFTAIFRMRPAFLHAGLAGATAALGAINIVFFCCINNSNGLGWLGYWPTAIAFMLAAIGIAALLAVARRHRSHET